MAITTQETLFALDCGATNWRLYRSSYLYSEGRSVLVGEPQISPLTSFVDRKLPASILLNPEGNGLDGFGEFAQHQLENENLREKVRDNFKPCIGNHLIKKPLPHQKRFTHTDSLVFTQLLLEALVEQIRMEKWRAGNFDERILFSFAYPVYWRTENDGAIFKDFERIVLSCFPDSYMRQIRFVAEPEGAILSLQRQGLMSPEISNGITFIIDVGGSTTDIVAGRAGSGSGILEYIGRFGEPFGGGLYDDVLAKYIADSLKIPPSAIADQPGVISTLRMFSNKLKETLSRQKLYPGDFSQSSQRSISLVLPGGEVYRRVIELNEEVFQEVAGSLNQEFEEVIERALLAIGVKEQHIGQIVLVGGGSQLFSIVHHLRKRFGDEKVILADNPEEIVVQGIGLEYGKSFEEYHPTITLTVSREEEKEVGSKPPDQQATWKLVSDDAQYLLDTPGVLKVGRDLENDIHINQERLSRFHAKFQISDDVVIIIDLGSTNGTFVNGKKIPPDQPQVVPAGAKIRFGDTEFLLDNN